MSADDEYHRLYVEAWELTDKADSLGARLSTAHGTPMFEQVRQEVQDFLEDDPQSRNPYVYLGHLQGWLNLYGLNTATAKPLFDAG